MCIEQCGLLYQYKKKPFYWNSFQETHAQDKEMVLYETQCFHKPNKKEQSTIEKTS